MKECPNCAVEIDDAARVCPICKYDFPARAVFPWKPVAVLLLVVILAPLLWKAAGLVLGR
jgi:hypothetical protein